MTKLHMALGSILFLISIVIPSAGFQNQDTVYQKNGEIIVGTILKDNPRSSLKIIVAPQNVWVLYYNNIEKINRYIQIGQSGTDSLKKNELPQRDSVSQKFTSGKQKQDSVFMKSGAIILGTIFEDNFGSNLKIMSDSSYIVRILNYHDIQIIIRAIQVNL